MEGILESDHFGNYCGSMQGEETRWRWSGSPLRPELGLTGKIWDDAVGAYYFNARWYDADRGRFLSREPLGLDGPNMYHFCFGKNINGIDYGGFGLMDWLHGAFDVVGTFDPFGVADGANALLYVGEGDWSNAGISFLGIIPYFGDAAKVGKYTMKAAKAVKNAKKVESAACEVMHVHHMLPRQFERYFIEAGLDIEKYTVKISKWKHILKPDGVHVGKGNWNTRWKEFFDEFESTGKQPSANEILEFMD